MELRLKRDTFKKENNKEYQLKTRKAKKMHPIKKLLQLSKKQGMKQLKSIKSLHPNNL